MIEVLSVVLGPDTDHGLNLAITKIVERKPTTHVNRSLLSCPSEQSEVAPLGCGQYNLLEPGALSITVRWTIVPPGFPIPTGRTLRPVFISEAAGASLVP